MSETPEERNPRCLVIGYGNTLRGDDAVGRLIAETIETWELPRVSVVSVHQLLPELAVDAADVGRVLFVDAVVHPGASPDDITGGAGVRLIRLAPAFSDIATSHYVEPAGLLHLTAALYGVAPEGYLLTVPGTEFDPGAPMSDAARDGMAVALELARAWLG